MPLTRADAIAILSRAGFLDGAEDADALARAAGGDDARYRQLVDRRATGEPLAWLVGSTLFCGHRILVHPGVYVPRPHSELVARRAADRLPSQGIAIDVCTGSGAIAVALARARPGARVLGCELDSRAVACAVANGVEVHQGDLLAPVPPDLAGAVDVIAGSVPYVPTKALRLLQRDTFTFESTLAYDGGPDGLALLRGAAEQARRLLRPGAALVLELGGDEQDELGPELEQLGYGRIEALVDDDGDVRGLESTFG